MIKRGRSLHYSVTSGIRDTLNKGEKHIMAVVFEGVSLRSLSDHGDILQRTESILRLEVVTENDQPVVTIYNGNVGF